MEEICQQGPSHTARDAALDEVVTLPLGPTRIDDAQSPSANLDSTRASQAGRPDGTGSTELSKPQPIAGDVASTSIVEANANVSIEPVPRLDPEAFPHAPQGWQRVLPTTMPNVAHLLKGYGIVVRYDNIKKNVGGLQGKS